ncbi:DUF1828 domain-containing protein [Vagococcus entomophilus]|nr:DUF1828 domain-containing protein [Vagococcus entomophilus]
MLTAKEITDNYFNWVKSNYNFSKLKNSGNIDIQTPFIDNFGDSISFIVKLENDQLIVTDEGYTIWNLSTMGHNVTRKKTHRRLILDSLLKSENAILSDNNELKINVRKNNIGQAIHDMTQLVIKINDMTMLSSSNVKNIFYDEALEYFNKNADIYRKLPSFQITGKSQLSHKIDFGFFTKDGVKLVKLHNTLTRNTIESAIVTLVDTSDYRLENYQETEKLCLLINGIDKSKITTDNHIESLAQYNIDIIDFTDKQDVRLKLSS